MLITRRTALKFVGAGLVAPAFGFEPAFSQTKPKIACVVKIGGSPWYNAMEAGMKSAGERLGAEASLVGPAQADAAQQVTLIEDMIARKVDVLGVVPNDVAALEPVVKRAIAAGIKVITHESPSQKYGAWNFELISAKALGEANMEALAGEMGGEGKYIVYVGSLTVESHNAWADAAIALQKAKYPNMQMVGDRYGVAESAADSYRTMLDQMRVNPDLKGLIAFGSQGPMGGCRAIEEKGKAAEIAVVGTISPSEGERYVKNRAFRKGYIWSPVETGVGVVELGMKLVAGQDPTNGMILGEIGALEVDAAARTVSANKPLLIDPSTIDELVKQGL